MMHQKDFFCMCNRCCDPDFLSGLPCGVSECKGMKLLSCRDRDTPGTWSCQVCKNTAAPVISLRELGQLKQRHTVLQREYSVSLKPNHVVKLEKLYEEALLKISHTNAFALLLQVSSLIMSVDGSSMVTGRMN
jgi:hypothetical protein